MGKNTLARHWIILPGAKCLDLQQPVCTKNKNVIFQNVRLQWLIWKADKDSCGCKRDSRVLGRVSVPVSVKHTLQTTRKLAKCNTKDTMTLMGNIRKKYIETQPCSWSLAASFHSQDTQFIYRNNWPIWSFNFQNLFSSGAFNFQDGWNRTTKQV